MASRSHTTSNQRWNNVVFANIETYNVECQINVVYFNADINSVRQHRNNVLFSNVEFHNIDKVETKLRISQFAKLFKRSIKVILSLEKKENKIQV